MLLLPEPLPLGDLPPHLLCLHSREHLVPEALGTFPRVLHGLTATRLHLLLVLHPHVDGTLEKREALFLKVIVVLDMILGKDNIDAPGLLRAVDTTWGTIILVTRTATNKLGVETVAIVESLLSKPLLQLVRGFVVGNAGHENAPIGVLVKLTKVRPT